MSSLTKSTSLLSLFFLATTATAQYGAYGGYGGSGNPYSSSNGNGNGNGDNGGFGGSSNFFGFDLSTYSTVLTAHAVLACVAFAFLFPVGGILIRLANFRGLWFVHGLLQVFAYVVYIAAFGIGIWVRRNPSLR